MNHFELAEQVAEGNKNPLDAYIELKTLLSEVQDALSSIEPLAIAERIKYGKENLVRQNFLIEYSDGTPRYSYKHYGAWGEANEHVKRIEEMMKQSAKLGKTIVDDSTGEIIEPASVTYTKPFLRLTFQK
jgi:hypothetical protein